MSTALSLWASVHIRRGSEGAGGSWRPPRGEGGHWGSERTKRRGRENPCACTCAHKHARTRATELSGKAQGHAMGKRLSEEWAMAPFFSNRVGSWKWLKVICVYTGILERRWPLATYKSKCKAPWRKGTSSQDSIPPTFLRTQSPAHNEK